MRQPEACIGTEHQDVYVQALASLTQRKLPFVLGGAFAVWRWTGHWRHTHDIDVFTPPEHVPAAVESLADAGFEDIGEQAPGDREWIYHSAKDQIIVDVIWRFANRLTSVTQDWIDRGQEGDLLGVKVKFIPIEELVWSKMFTLNRHRCDWPDIMRIFRANCPTLEWDRLLGLLGEHWLLFAAVVDVFDWQYPADEKCIPDHIRKELVRRREEYRPDPSVGTREQLLDPWIHSRPEDICYWEQ